MIGLHYRCEDCGRTGRTAEEIEHLRGCIINPDPEARHPFGNVLDDLAVEWDQL